MVVQVEDVARTALKIFPIMGRLMDAYMRVGEYSLSGVHFQVLVSLTVRPCTVSELAERQGVSAASMSKTLLVLEERGWLMRHRNDQDRRMVHLVITPQGRTVLHDVQTRSEESLIETFKHLPQDELKIIMDGLEHLIKAFAHGPMAMPPDPDPSSPE
jgi:DNA-binding MarR family transcriptional regulator